MKTSETCQRKVTGVFGDLRVGSFFYLHIGGNCWSQEVCEKTGPFDLKCGDEVLVASFWQKVEAL